MHMATTPASSSTYKRPPRLAAGDRIAVVAPAGPFDSEKFEIGLAVMRTWGLIPEPAPHVYDRRSHLAGSDTDRAADLAACLADPDLKAIICARGGYGCLRLLPLMADVGLDGPAKWLVGFSDITALHQYIHQRVGWATLHGPMVTTLASADAATRDHLWSLLSGAGEAPLSYPLGEVLLPGVARGVIIGGNLTTLSHLLGTPYQPDFTDCLLFLEDVGEAPYRIDRILTQMALAGCLKGLAGVALGQFTDCGAWEAIRQIFKERLAPYGIPLAAGLAAGHGSPNMALPLGMTATLDTDALVLVYDEPPAEVA
jgi:muramoyltetrapeptide carboxypeptidase